MGEQPLQQEQPLQDKEKDVPPATEEHAQEAKESDVWDDLDDEALFKVLKFWLTTTTRLQRGRCSRRLKTRNRGNISELADLLRPILTVVVIAVKRFVARLHPVMTSLPTLRLRTPSDKTRNPSTNGSMTAGQVTTTATPIMGTTLHGILTDTGHLPVISTVELT